MDSKPTLEQFKQEFKKFHICGIPTIPYDLAYDSSCPQCESDGGWEQECEWFYSHNRTIRFANYWYSQEQIDEFKSKKGGAVR